MKTSKAFIFVIVITAFACLIAAFSFAKKNAEKKLQDTVEVHLLQIINELEITLERHSYLPSLLSNDGNIVSFLKTPIYSDRYPERQRKINSSLELSSNISGTTNIYLMDPLGNVLASSNWAEKDSYINQNFSSQPYFKQAKQNSLGRYFSIQTDTGEHHYFFANSIQFNKEVIGIITVQIPLSDIASNWTVSEVDFAITDNAGVIFLSSKSPWNFKAITKPKKGLLTFKNDQYNNSKMLSLNNQEIDLKQESFLQIQLLSETYLMKSQRMQTVGWDVRALSQYSIAKKEITRNTFISAVLITLSTLLALLLLNIQNQRNAFRQKARIALEDKVEKRTEALRKTQEELIQAAKLAAIGQLSIGISHEINNPLTAIRSYADNAEQFLKRDELDIVKSNLKEISKLTENMAAITRQLKAFSRKSSGELKEVNLTNSITNAISIVHTKIASSGTNIHFEYKESKLEFLVIADEVWLSQILVNLISNAISATTENAEKNHEKTRDIWININEKIDIDKKSYAIEVKDNGTGINESDLGKIFEPFFTTKPISKGLGLGLSISYNLAKDMNGSLEARNNKEGGALFILTLPSSFT